MNTNIYTEKYFWLNGDIMYFADKKYISSYPFGITFSKNFKIIKTGYKIGSDYFFILKLNWQNCIKEI